MLPCHSLCFLQTTENLLEIHLTNFAHLFPSNSSLCSSNPVKTKQKIPPIPQPFQLLEWNVSEKFLQAISCVERAAQQHGHRPSSCRRRTDRSGWCRWQGGPKPLALPALRHSQPLTTPGTHQGVKKSQGVQSVVLHMLICCCYPTTLCRCFFKLHENKLQEETYQGMALPSHTTVRGKRPTSRVTCS